MKIIGVIAGREKLLADFRAVQIGLADTQTAEIQPRGPLPLFTEKALSQQRGVPILRGADPAAHPGLVPFAGLEGGGSLGALAVHSPDGQSIVIACPRKKPQRHRPAEAVGRRIFAAVVDGLSFGAYFQRGPKLPAGSFLHGPGKDRLLHGKAQGLGQIADAQIVQLHSSLLSFRCIASSPST